VEGEEAEMLVDTSASSAHRFMDARTTHHLADPSQIPQIAERLFQALDATVEFVPVMNPDDLRKGLEKVSS